MPVDASILDGFKNLLLELTLDLLALVIGGRLPMEVQQCTQVKLRRLEQLDLADMNLELLVDVLAAVTGTESLTFCSG